ncbi:conserved hypothetical protein [Candida dubliniensis CD36]|uniref:Uncharacterized protein n=1 Tax=Candida dubliniensis (strain CD36 / ATCC MYA-646 / CBS 7987 / NCPF 3949 / NRRL Y-17841) TaxID=573826 RepID=B9W6N0_CANDC|nr:conserved hypothetical protein [Candida dubliniensis CD36]CAX44335.1 conserved hypothetical protein [Candida dubliniensis CD36]
MYMCLVDSFQNSLRAWGDEGEKKKQHKSTQIKTLTIFFKSSFTFHSRFQLNSLYSIYNMWKSLLGLDNDDSKLINQPTIDYNTISSPSKQQQQQQQPQQPQQQPQQPQQPHNNNPLNNKPNNQTYGTVIDYSDLEDDNDDNDDYEYLDLDNDIKTNTRLINQWRNNKIHSNNRTTTTVDAVDNQNGSFNYYHKPTSTSIFTNVSLPDQYPGKFPHLNKHTHNDFKKNNSIDLLSLQDSKQQEKQQEKEYESIIDAKIQALQKEIDNNNDNDNDNDNKPFQNITTTNTTSSSSGSASNIIDEINNLQLKITSQTETLREINDLIDIYEYEYEYEIDLSSSTTSINLQKLIINYKDYQNLKNDYINELNRVKKLYEAYYLLFNRYITLKKDYKKKYHQQHHQQDKDKEKEKDKEKVILSKKKKNNDDDDDDDDDKEIGSNNKNGHKYDDGNIILIKEKINQIKFKSNDLSIKNICDELLNDVTKFGK